MKTILLTPVLAIVALLAAESSASAQTSMRISSGSSYSSRQSTTWMSGPSGTQFHSQSSGHARQWGSVQIDSRTPAGHFQGSFSAGSSHSWDIRRGGYSGPYGTGSYGSIQTDRSQWNQGRWSVGTPYGNSFGGGYRNFDRDTRHRSWSR